MNQNKFWKQAMTLVLVFLLAGVYKYSENNQPASDGLATIAAAAAAKRSEVWFEEAPFTIKKTLPDDNHGSRHQRFLVQAPGLPSLLVAHNIDLAERAPLRAGQRIFIKGRYEWNDKGGVIHWTHHDPRGRKPGGWLRLADVVYQ
ncbi:MAG: DUF3465 domain-containing protein [Cellvibrionaceae bacterium]|nr:DUF3465 domain-containing protein [Cellvibrionaceae bacterium]MCV6626865.1 DUF3465 domain-containing protein [Cellvibrionaceae bacterium]